MLAQQSGNVVGAFLSAFAGLVLDNVSDLERAASRVSELVIGGGRPDRDLIVALQSFDRLKQEFEALGGALAHYADVIGQLPFDGDEGIQLGRDAVATITVADLKHRMMGRLDSDMPGAMQAALVPAMAGEVGLDVEF
jgi:hypothetical protein